MSNKYYVVLTKDKRNGQFWLNSMGDYGHLLREQLALIFFDELSQSPNYTTQLCELVISSDLTTSLRVLKEK